MAKYTAKIEGMKCPKCEAHVKKALENLNCKDVTVSHEKGEAVFSADSISEADVKKAVDDLGFSFKSLKEGGCCCC